MNRFILLISLIVLTLGVAGCDGGRERGGQTSVRVLHAAPSFGAITFLRVERPELSELPYRGGASMTFDADHYTFNVEVLPLGLQTPERVLTFSETVREDTAYYFVMTETDGQMHPLIIDLPFDEGDADGAQVVATHAGPDVPPADVYLEPFGTDHTTAQPLGRIGFGETVEPRRMPPGRYELTLTAPGDPSNVLLQNPSVELAAGEAHLFAVIGMGGEGVAPLGVAWMHRATELLVDRDVGAAVRVLNAAGDRAPRDVIIDETFSEPFEPALPFGVVRPYQDITPGQATLNVTPAGTTGVIELDDSVIFAAGRLHTLLLGGDPGELDHVFVVDDRRSIGDRARIRLLNGVNLINRLDFFIVSPGTNISERLPNGVLDAPGVSAYQAYPPGDYEIVVRQTGTDTIVAGPVAVTLSGGGVYGVLALDGDGSGEMVELVLYDDFE